MKVAPLGIVSQRRLLAQLAAVGVLTAGAIVVWADEARAAIGSTADLKQACETSPNNVVDAGSDVKVSTGVGQGGAYASVYEEVATGCTVRLAPGVRFETEGVAMSFNGPFEVRGSGQGSVLFRDSAWRADSMAFSLPGTGSEFRTDTSRVETTQGNIAVNAGADANLQFGYRSGGTYALRAEGDVSIAGGDRTIFEVNNTSLNATGKLDVSMKGRDANLKLVGRPSLVGDAGLNVNLGGGTPALAAEGASLFSLSGPATIASTAPKALVELQSSRIFGGLDTKVNLRGSEASLKSALTRFQSETGRVDLLAGGPSSVAGAIELQNSDIYSETGASVQASPSGQRGLVKVSGGSIRGGSGDALIRTGAAGETEVKDSSLWSSRTIRILTGSSGTCVAENNSYISPARQICR